MRRTSTSIAFALYATVLSSAGCDSSTGGDKSIALSLSSNSLTLAQGASQQINVTIQRSNFEQPVALSIQGQLPQGVTAEFGQSSLPAGVSTTVLTVEVAGNAAPTSSGSFTVRAAGEGVAEQTQAVTISVAVTGTYTLGLLEPQLSVAQGGGGNVTVLVTRNNGNAGDVALSVGTLPAGVTATFAQPTTTAGAGSLTFSVGTGVAPGTYPITITSSSPGHTPDQTTTLSLVVVAPPATASVTVPFCPAGVPSWFAYRNEGYPWQQVSPTGSGFTFNATQRVTIAFVFTFAGGSDFNVYQLDRSELGFFNDNRCSGTRNYTGTVAGLTTGQSALIALGSSTDLASASQPSFLLEEVRSGALDLIATRGIIASNTFPSPDRVIVRRGLDLPTASTIPELNFAAAESFAPAAHAATVTNVVPGSTISIQNSFLTTTTLGLLQFAQASTMPVSLYFVPADKMVATDLHEFYADATQSNFDFGQGYVEYTGTVGDRSVALGAPLAAPTVTMLSSGTYSRPRVTFSAQSEYGSIALAQFLQSSLSSQIFVTLVVSDAHLGGTPATWDVSVPDFTGAPGFNSAWMLQRGISTQYLTEAFGGSNRVLFGEAPVAGDSYRFGYRQSSVTTAVRLRHDVSVRRRPPTVQYLSR